MENANSRFWNYWSISPKGIAETYGTVISSFADNVISATRLTNNAVSANMELFSTFAANKRQFKGVFQIGHRI